MRNLFNSSSDTVQFITYENRNELRDMKPSDGQMIGVASLGVFIYDSTSNEPDDDETCFRTINGAWLLQAVSYDLAQVFKPGLGMYVDRYPADLSAVAVAANATVQENIDINGIMESDILTTVSDFSLPFPLTSRAQPNGCDSAAVFISNPTGDAINIPTNARIEVLAHRGGFRATPGDYIQGYRLIGSMIEGRIDAQGLVTLLEDPKHRASLSVALDSQELQDKLIGCSEALEILAGSILSGFFEDFPEQVRRAAYENNQAEMAFGDAWLEWLGSNDLSSALAHADLGEESLSLSVQSGLRVSEDLALLMPGLISSDALASSVYHGALVPLGGYVGCVRDIGEDKWLVIQAPKEYGERISIKWKTTNTTSEGTSDVNFGLVNADNQNNASHPLFQWARGLEINGFTDWAPPAVETQVALFNKMGYNVTQAPLFKSGGSQAYSEQFYWSATQFPSSTDQAWRMYFTDGTKTSYNKAYAVRARVVRMIKV